MGSGRKLTRKFEQRRSSQSSARGPDIITFRPGAYTVKRQSASSLGDSILSESASLHEWQSTDSGASSQTLNDVPIRSRVPGSPQRYLSSIPSELSQEAKSGIDYCEIIVYTSEHRANLFRRRYLVDLHSICPERRHCWEPIPNHLQRSHVV